MKAQTPGTLMAIGAHHDDNEIWGCTLDLYRRAGWRAISCVMTDGRFILEGSVSEKNIAIREAESIAAAALIGAECEFLRLPEGDMRGAYEERSVVLRAIRKYRPAIVITHPPHDYHLDHEITSRLVLAAVYQSWCPTVECDIEPCERPVLYYGDAWFVPFEPDEYIDISDNIQIKLDMLACHKSQIPADGGESMLDLAKVQNRHRGIEAGVEYAEAFRLVPCLGRVRLARQLSCGCAVAAGDA